MAVTLAVVNAPLGGCAAGMSRLKSGISSKPGMMSMPDLFGMAKAKAIATLQLAGHRGDVAWDDQLCGSVIDGQIVEKGDVCRQHPAPGAEMTVDAPVRILVQPEDPRHGRIGETGEWHLMPDVVGMPVTEAQAALRAAGFTDDRTHVDASEDRGCKPGVVCKTYPAALERAGQASDRYLTVGVHPAARAVPTREPEPEPQPEPEPDAPPPATPPKPPETYF